MTAAGATDRVEPSVVAEFLEHLLRVRDFSPQTVRTYAAAILDFQRRMDIADPASATTADIERYLTRAAIRGIRPNTRRTRLNALRTFYGFLVKRSRIPADPTDGVRGPAAKDRDRVPVFTEKEIERLTFGYREPDLVRGRREPLQIFRRRDRVANLKAARDTAMLALAYSLGLRASELGRLMVADYRVVDRIRAVVLREGKWAREPVAMRVDDRVAAALEAYLVARGPREHREALFAPLAARRQDTREPDRGISRTQVAAILARRVRIAGITAAGRRLSPHVLRYSIATHLHDAGMGDRELQVFMRHQSIETTFRYIRLGSERQIRGRAIRLLPWNRRRVASRRSMVYT